MSDSATPWIAAHQAPPPMGFSRQEYWSGVPLPSPSSNRMLFSDLVILQYLLSTYFVLSPFIDAGAPAEQDRQKFQGSVQLGEDK